MMRHTNGVVQVSVYLSVKMSDRFSEYCYKNRKFKSEFLREAIQEAIDND